MNNSSNNKSPLPSGLQPLSPFLSYTVQLLYNFLWINLSNIRFRFDVSTRCGDIFVNWKQRVNRKAE